MDDTNVAGVNDHGLMKHARGRWEAFAADMDMEHTREWRYLIRNGVERISAAVSDLLQQQSTEATDDTVKLQGILIAVLFVCMVGQRSLRAGPRVASTQHPTCAVLSTL